MRVREFAVKNFRSLKDIHLRDLENLVILIGENNSGKTNILEAASWFFSEFAHYASRFKRELTDEDSYLWFSGATEEPIQFQASLELDQEETRELVKVVGGEEVEESTILEVRRLLVCKDKGLYDLNDWIRWRSIAVRREEERFASDEVVKFDLDGFVQVVSRLISESFTCITFGREAKPEKPHALILDPTVKDQLLRIAADSSAAGIRKWSQWKAKCRRRGLIPEHIDYKQGQLVVYKEDAPVLYELEGGGYQGFLNLMELIEEQGDIVAIEEPENHLHPKLQKRLLGQLKELLNGKKQIFIATHSPFFIDHLNLKGAWFVYREGLESRAVNISTQAELSKAFWEIGIKPSDFLFANGVLVVEGKTDKMVLSDWARKIGRPFEDQDLLLVDVDGFGNVRKYLESEVVRRTSFRRFCFCIVDKNAKEKVAEQLKELIPAENFFPLEKGDLEDYYPRKIVQEFGEKWAEKKGKAKEVPCQPKEGQTVETLNRLLGKNWWKDELAKEVVEKTGPEDVPEEIKTIVLKIHGAVEKP